MFHNGGLFHFQTMSSRCEDQQRISCLGPPSVGDIQLLKSADGKSSQQSSRDLIHFPFNSPTTLIWLQTIVAITTLLQYIILLLYSNKMKLCLHTLLFSGIIFISEYHQTKAVPNNPHIIIVFEEFQTGCSRYIITFHFIQILSSLMNAVPSSSLALSTVCFFQDRRPFITRSN